MKVRAERGDNIARIKDNANRNCLLGVYNLPVFCTFLKINIYFYGVKDVFVRIYNFYADGSRNMTWGRQLWWLILLKVIILFVVLRCFFFTPVLAGKSEEQKIEHVGEQLVKPTIE